MRAAVREGNTSLQLLAIRTLQHLGPAAAAAADDLEVVSRNAALHVRFNALVALVEVDPNRTMKACEQLLVVAADEDAEHHYLVKQSLARTGPVGLQRLVTTMNWREPSYSSPGSCHATTRPRSWGSSQRLAAGRSDPGFSFFANV